MIVLAPVGVDITNILDRVQSPEMKGYVATLANHIADAVGPKEGTGARTSLWGLQRPPMNGSKTIITVDNGDSFDDIAPILLPFFMTNAHDQLVLSVPDGMYDDMCQAVEGTDISVVNGPHAEEAVWNTVSSATSAEHGFPMVGQWLSLIFPMGHIKSVESDHRHFVDVFSASPKWLQMRE